MESDQKMTSARRIEGLDVARSLAIFGMMIVHFMLVMTDKMPPQKWSTTLLYLLDGRPAATFVILAGMGMTLMARKASASGAVTDRKKIEKVFHRRGVLLLILGFLNLAIWEGDILRVYGVSLLIVPFLIWRSGRTVMLTALGFLAAFGVLFVTLDYDKNWDWTTMTYHGLWTVSGLLRSLFYDGFRSVFPWTGLLLLGVWLGRLDWSTDGIPRKAMVGGLTLVISTAVLSNFVVHWLDAHPQPGLNHETSVALFGLISMPPLPMFLLNATGCALLVIGASTLIARRGAGWLAVRALSATGRMALTWYMAHIVLGLGGVIVLGWLRTSPLQALATATMFFAGAVTVSLWWSQHFASGPLESVLRKVGRAGD